MHVSTIGKKYHKKENIPEIPLEEWYANSQAEQCQKKNATCCVSLLWLLLFFTMLEILFLDIIISLMVLYKTLLMLFYRNLIKFHVKVEENRKMYWRTNQDVISMFLIVKNMGKR